MQFGARMLKTGMAVTLALYIAGFFAMKSPVLAAVAAIFAMQPTIYRSWRYFLEQLQGNILGGVVAISSAMLLSNQPFVIGLICIVIIMLCMKLGMEESIGLTLVTVIAVMDAYGAEDSLYALNRFLQTLTGIVSAFVINIIFFPPDPKVQILSQVQLAFSKMSILIRTVISNEMKEAVFNESLEKLEDSLKTLDDKYKLLEEEHNKLKRRKRNRPRELVVYRQMLIVLQKGMEALRSVEQHYFHSARLPETDEKFDHHFERLVKFHELVLLKFENKLKPDVDELKRLEEENEQFMRSAAALSAGGDERAFRLSIVAAAMYDYGYHTSRLDQLIDQYYRGNDSKEPTKAGEK